MSDKNEAMNDWIYSRVNRRRITTNAGQAVDRVQALHAEVRELRRDIARANGEQVPESLQELLTMNDFIRESGKRGGAKK